MTRVSSSMRRRNLRVHACAGAIFFLFTNTSFATDFLRGDANGDGKVSLADAHYIEKFLFLGGSPPECLQAADVDASDRMNITDGIRIVNYLLLGGQAPPAPFPAPGPGPEESSLPCDSYGSGALLDDPAAKLGVLEATAAGGADGSGRLVLAISNSTSIAGYTIAVSFPDGIIVHVEKKPDDLSGSSLENSSVIAASLEGNTLTAGFLASLTQPASIASGEDQPVLEIEFCLAEGVSAGEYPLVVEAGELVDNDSARSIEPVLVSGTLVVHAAVTSNTCDAGGGGVIPDPVENPEVEFRLGDAIATPGTIAQVPLFIRSNGGVQGFSFSIDFNEELLQVDQIEEIVLVGTDGFKRLEYNNDNHNPGSAGIDEGFLVGAEVFSFERPLVLPQNQDNLVFKVHFEASAEVEEATTEIRFLDGGKGSGQAVSNVATVQGKAYDPHRFDSFVLVNGTFFVLPVLPDVTVFIRGDANDDRTIDISDAQTTLGFLFLGDRNPVCRDAADANDDSVLNIADPVYVLGFLFLGGNAPPSPFPLPGEDPTDDTIGCRLLLPQ
jgi:hypothetical protein